MNDIKKILLNYINRSNATKKIEADDDLFETGIVHSLFAMQLILFIEKEFDIEIDDEELDFEKIKTINDIVDLVSKKL